LYAGLESGFEGMKSPVSWESGTTNQSKRHAKPQLTLG
jgi:hypothetical protein